MRHRTALVLILIALLAIMSSAFAQGEVDPETQVRITWPPAVSELFGTGDVIGNAAVPGMVYYYLEYLQLNNDLTEPSGAPWIPATIAIQQAVNAGVLATIDTTTVEDGVYSLRLVVNLIDGTSLTYTVSPLRISNARFDAILTTAIEEALADAGVIPDAETAPPTPEPTPVVVDQPPSAFPVATGTVNVRQCDLVDNSRCPIVGFMTREGAAITALSARNNEWVQVRLSSSLLGWVAVSVIRIDGDVANLPRQMPPDPLPPPAVADIRLSGITVPQQPICGAPFAVNITLFNAGNATANGGAINVQDVNIRTGETTASTSIGFPSLAPGASLTVTATVTTTVYYNEAHEVRAYLGNQTGRATYVLQQGGCNPQPTPPPPPPPDAQDIVYNANQCFIILTNGKMSFDLPYGSPYGVLDPASYMAERSRISNGVRWFRVTNSVQQLVWVEGTSVETQGGCLPLVAPR